MELRLTKLNIHCSAVKSIKIQNQDHVFLCGRKIKMHSTMHMVIDKLASDVTSRDYGPANVASSFDVGKINELFFG
jgi:hypothetical protein